MGMPRGMSACLSVVFGGAVALASAPGCSSTPPGSSFEEDGGSRPTGGSVDSPASGSNDPFGGGSIDWGSIDGGAPPPERIDGGCASAEAAANLAPVYMLIVLDGSGSMQSTDVDKWGAAQKAFNAFFKDAHDKNDTTIGVGLVLFSGNLGEQARYYPNREDVPDTRMIDDAQLAKLQKRIGARTPPGGTTPTEAAMSACYPRMQQFKTEAAGPNDTGFADVWARTYGPLLPNGKKVIVLASDGVPTGNNDKAEVEALAADNFNTNKILTFAIGIGPFPGDKTGYDPEFMGKVAKAGGTAPTGCQPDAKNLKDVCHFQITPGGDSDKIAEDLLAAINRIRQVAAGCEYVLGAQNGTIDPTKVNVIVKESAGGEVLVPKDPKSGWTYDNDQRPTRVILHGAVCENVKKDPNAKVRIVLGCKSAVN